MYVREAVINYGHQKLMVTVDIDGMTVRVDGEESGQVYLIVDELNDLVALARLLGWEVP